MSRTDVHRPVWVQEKDFYARHRFRRSQVWPMKEPALVPIHNICGCWWCRGGHCYREVRRRSRHQAQRLCRELIKNREKSL